MPPSPRFNVSIFRNRKRVCYIRAYSLSASLDRTQEQKVEKPFTGSVPYYESHLVIHSPQPSTEWPSRFEAESILIKLGKRAKRWQGLVNMSYDPSASTYSSGHRQLSHAWTNRRHDAALESFNATLYRPSQAPLHVFPLSVTKSLPEYMGDMVSGRSPSPGAEREIHIYVCTHGSRDCRCGEIGGAVFRALKDAVKEMKRSDVVVREITHVGGHAWAANIITYPKGDWYGQITQQDVPRLLSTILRPSADVWIEKWRGRTGLTPDNQHEMAAKLLHQAQFEKEQRMAKNGTKISLSFVTAEGRESVVDAEQGETLMEVGKRAGFESIEGACGGNLECATCHMLIPSDERSPLPPPPLPPMSEEEDDMLAYAIGRREGQSRLGCQIKVSQELRDWCFAGGRIGIPKY